MNPKLLLKGFKNFPIWILFACFLSPPILAFSGIDKTASFEGSSGLLPITGKVTDAESGEVLIGASVRIKETTRGALTNSEGTYQIEAEPGEILIFSYIGYETIELPVEENTLIDVSMIVAASALDEVVVVGYGSQRKRDVTGAIASVDVEELEQRAPTNVFEAIQGQMAGVQINTGSGAPGSAGFIRIRGASTFNAGTAPLFILDGQPVENIDNLNPNDIESVEVLKDGASAAIYGSRSANGVVIITTKSGIAGKTDVSVNYLRSYSTLRKMPVSNAQQRLQYDLLRGTQKNTLIDTLNQMWFINNDFQDIYYRTAVRDQINVSLTSGSEKTRFYWNTGFLNQEGVAPSQKFQRFNTRLGLDHNFSDRVRLGLKLAASYNESFNIDEARENNFFGATLIKAAYSPYINPDGSFLTSITSFRGRTNLLYEMENLEVTDRNLRGNIFQYLEFDLLKGLKYRANLGAEFNYIRNTVFEPEAVGGQNNNIGASFFSALEYNWIHESLLFYDKSFGDHTLSILAGFSAQKWGRPEERIEGLLANSLLPTLNNVAGAFDATNTFTLNEEDRSLASVFGRIRYDYRNTVLLSATLRRDGSSRFGPGNRWSNFPSLAVGWRISEWNPIKNLSLVNDVKIRASYAITGNERINNRDFDPLLSIGNFYQGLNGVGLSNQLANPAIQWEETRQTNIGLDLGLWDNRITLTTDYYIKQTEDLLANLPLPAQTGFTQARVNLGEVENRGIELALQAVLLNTQNFSWTTNFNFATNTNEVISMASGVPLISRNHITQEGLPLGSFYGYRILGIFAHDESNAFSPDGQQLTPNFDGNGNFIDYSLNGSPYSGEVNQLSVGGNTSGGGDYIYKDNDGNFSINGDDREILGNPYPKYFGGWRNEFQYKEVSFSFLFDYQFEAEVFNFFHQTMSNFTLNSWTPIPYIIENTYDGPGDESALFPDGRRSQNLLGTGAPTSYWVEEADFIKLRNVRLSYNFPMDIIERVKLENLMLFGSINNALVWTNYTGFDPEVTGGNASSLATGVDNARYPRGREFIFGLNLGF
ncbi:MAG: TonB-dependent receptor [Bacteroidota bacterium]